MSQLTRGKKRRLMYIENKDGDIDGAKARIGGVIFSKTGRTVYYRGRALRWALRGVRGNFFDTETSEESWISGVKRWGSNVHWAEPVSIVVDDDAFEERHKGGTSADRDTQHRSNPAQAT